MKKAKVKSMRGRTILKRLGMFMTISGIIFMAFCILVIVFTFLCPQAFADFYEKYLQNLDRKGNVSLTFSEMSKDQIYQFLSCVLWGYNLILYFFYFRNGLFALRFAGKPKKAKKLRKKGIMLAFFAGIALISAIVHQDWSNIPDKIITEIINGFYLAGALYNMQEAKAAAVKNGNETVVKTGQEKEAQAVTETEAQTVTEKEAQAVTEKEAQTVTEKEIQTGTETIVGDNGSGKEDAGKQIV